LFSVYIYHLSLTEDEELILRSYLKAVILSILKIELLEHEELFLKDASGI